jgi:excisionase family DNA binding protein
LGDCIQEESGAYWKSLIDCYASREIKMDTRSNENAAGEMKYVESKLPARLLAVDEVARFLGVHSSTVRRWEKTGLLKSYPIGPHNNLRFKQEDILNFLDTNARRREVS